MHNNGQLWSTHLAVLYGMMNDVAYNPKPKSYHIVRDAFKMTSMIPSKLGHIPVFVDLYATMSRVLDRRLQRLNLLTNSIKA